MSWVTLMIAVMIVVSIMLGIYLGKEAEDVFLGVVVTVVALLVCLFVTVIMSGLAYTKNTTTYQEEIEVSAITFGDKTEMTYIPVSTVSGKGTVSTTIVPSSKTSSNVTYINKETGKVGNFSPDKGTFLVGKENKIIVTYRELTKDNAWYGLLGKDKTATEYIVTMVEEK